MFSLSSKYKIILVIFLGLILRVYDFGNNPPPLYVDEVSHGYNAYSLLLTGKDEYGKSWPIFLRSLGTYPSSLYAYLTTVPIKFFGLNTVSVRITSLIAGIILVFITTIAFGWRLGLVVAISPLFVFISRAAFEPNLGLMLFFLGFVLAPRRLLLSFIFISLSSYAHHSFRFLAPAFLIYFTYIYKKPRLLILALLIQIPLLFVSFTPGANSRLSTVASNQSHLRLYLAYFSPNNLFSKPDPDPQRSFPELSVFYWWMIFPLIYGISQIKSIPKPLLFLLFISPIPGAITKDYFSTLRVLPLFICISWIIAQGLKKFPYIVIIPLALVELYSNLILLKHERSSIWGHDYPQLVAAIKQFPHQQIVVDNARLKPVYIYLAFYNQYHPQKLQSRYDENWLKNYYDHTQFDNNFSIDNIQIRPINWEKDIYKDQILIADNLAISDQQAREHKLEFLNSTATFKIYRTHPELKYQK